MNNSRLLLYMPTRGPVKERHACFAIFQIEVYAGFKKKDKLD